MIRLWLTLAVTAVCAASSARAQDAGPPRLEIGGNFSAVLPIVMADGPAVLVGGGPQLAFSITPRIGIALLAEVLGPVESAGITGLYTTQLRLPLTKSRRTHPLALTVGIAGLFSYNPHPELRLRRPDGSIAVHPAYRSFRATAPGNLVAGVERGYGIGIGRSTSGSFALQGVFGSIGGFGVRAAAGVSFGVGRHR